MFSACTKPTPLMNGVFNEKLEKYYIEGKTISFTCNDLHDAEPRDPNRSDLHDGVITCGKHGWVASHFCHPGIKNNFNKTHCMKMKIL